MRPRREHTPRRPLPQSARPPLAALGPEGGPTRRLRLLGRPPLALAGMPGAGGTTARPHLAPTAVRRRRRRRGTLTTMNEAEGRGLRRWGDCTWRGVWVEWTGWIFFCVSLPGGRLPWSEQGMERGREKVLYVSLGFFLSRQGPQSWQKHVQDEANVQTCLASRKARTARRHEEVARTSNEFMGGTNFPPSSTYTVRLGD